VPGHVAVASRTSRRQKQASRRSPDVHPQTTSQPRARTPPDELRCWLLFRSLFKATASKAACHHLARPPLPQLLHLSRKLSASHGAGLSEEVAAIAFSPEHVTTLAAVAGFLILATTSRCPGQGKGILLASLGRREEDGAGAQRDKADREPHAAAVHLLQAPRRAVQEGQGALRPLRRRPAAPRLLGLRQALPVPLAHRPVVRPLRCTLSVVHLGHGLSMLLVVLADYILQGEGAGREVRGRDAHQSLDGHPAGEPTHTHDVSSVISCVLVSDTTMAARCSRRGARSWCRWARCASSWRGG
jgi:hypothetical protein